MRVAVCGRNLDDLLPLLERFGVERVERDPDLVISYGGDGALLGAERDYPGIPKCPIRDSRTSEKCPEHSEAELLSRLLAQDLPAERIIKLVGCVSQEREVIGLNDVVINKENIASAVRFRVCVDGVLYAEHQIVGDGLVAATPFGSTGFYRAITRSLFRLGIGLAFNNTTEPLDHLVVGEDTHVDVEILRGPAVLLADNSPDRIPLTEGDHVLIRRHPQKVTVHGLDSFRCRRCFELRYREEPCRVW